MYIVLGILLTILGIFMSAKPQAFYELTERWKSSGDAEPSKQYIKKTRLRGIWVFLVGIVDTVILLFFT